MEFELAGIFRVKVVAKNILLGSLGTQRQAVLAVSCLFLKKHTHFLKQTITLKQYTSLNNVKEVSFCLANRAFLFVGP